MQGETRPVIPPRELTNTEKSLLQYLLSKPFPGSAELRQQLESARVSEEYVEDASVVLTVDRQHAKPAPVARRVPVEAEGMNTNGVSVSVLLHVVHGFLDELEVFAEDAEPVTTFPDPSTLAIIILPDDAG